MHAQRLHHMKYLITRSKPWRTANTVLPRLEWSENVYKKYPIKNHVEISQKASHSFCSLILLSSQPRVANFLHTPLKWRRSTIKNKKGNDSIYEIKFCIFLRFDSVDRKYVFPYLYGYFLALTLSVFYISRYHLLTGDFHLGKYEIDVYRCRLILISIFFLVQLWAEDMGDLCSKMAMTSGR